MQKKVIINYEIQDWILKIQIWVNSDLVGEKATVNINLKVFRREMFFLITLCKKEFSILKTQTTLSIDLKKLWFYSYKWKSIKIIPFIELVVDDKKLGKDTKVVKEFEYNTIEIDKTINIYDYLHPKSLSIWWFLTFLGVISFFFIFMLLLWEELGVPLWLGILLWLLWLLFIKSIIFKPNKLEVNIKNFLFEKWRNYNLKDIFSIKWVIKKDLKNVEVEVFTYSEVDSEIAINSPKEKEVILFDKLYSKQIDVLTKWSDNIIDYLDWSISFDEVYNNYFPKYRFTNIITFDMYSKIGFKMVSKKLNYVAIFDLDTNLDEKSFTFQNPKFGKNDNFKPEWEELEFMGKKHEWYIQIWSLADEIKID